MTKYYWHPDENYNDPTTWPRIFYKNKKKEWMGAYYASSDKKMYHFKLKDEPWYDGQFNDKLFKPAKQKHLKLYPPIMEELKKDFYQDVLTS